MVNIFSSIYSWYYQFPFIATIITITALGYIHHIWLFLSTPYTRVEYVRNKRNTYIVNSIPSLLIRFMPVFWAMPAILQTLLFVFWSGIHNFSRDRFLLQKEIIPVKNGQVALHWNIYDNSIYEKKNRNKSPIVLILAGMLGKRDILFQSGDHYIHRFVWNLHNSNPTWRCVIKSWRGIGTELSGLAEDWGCQSVDDLHQTVMYIHSQYPLAPIYGVGFSYGGTQVITYLGLYHDSPMCGGVAFSAPHDLYQAMLHLPSPYDFFNSRSLFRTFLTYKNFEYLAKTNNHNYDDTINALHNQTKNCLCSCPWHPAGWGAQHLFKIIPDIEEKVKRGVSQTLQAIPKVSPPELCKTMREAGKDNPNIIWINTRHGGHCGWFHGWLADCWVDNPAIEFLTAIHTEINK